MTDLHARDRVRLDGFVVARVFLHGRLRQQEGAPNLITQVGDQFYLERPWSIGTVAAATGMQLGTGTTAVAKTGAGAAIVTYLAGSAKAFDATPVSSLVSTSRQIEVITTWGAGVATSSAITEAAVITQSVGTNAAAPAAATIARVKFASALNKSNSLAVLVLTWHHTGLGA